MRTFSPRAGLLGLAIALASAAPSPADDTPAAPVAIFPSAEVLPANHLKFYLHFAEPMRQGVFLEHCALLDESGQPVREPFRETELWSDDRRRLTLWLHPGRQKTGVNLNVELGPVLEPGRTYTLRISEHWPTENGAPLARGIAKRFRTSAKVSAQLDTAAWQIRAPKSATREPIEVRFPAPLDYALLQRCLRVVNADGHAVAGQVGIGPRECSWLFTPATAWPAQPCQLIVDSILEDLAGNSLARPFEVDLYAPAQGKVPPILTLDFRPGL